MRHFLIRAYLKKFKLKPCSKNIGLALNCQKGFCLRIWQVSVSSLALNPALIQSAHICDSKISILSFKKIETTSTKETYLNVAPKSDFKIIDWTSILSPMIEDVVGSGVSGTLPKHGTTLNYRLIA